MITRVVITQGGTERALSLDEWKRLVLTERVALLADDLVRFYAGATPLSAREALAALKNPA
jgi:hypothetical protein